KWKAFANSLKLRILVQTRLASSQVGIPNAVTEINKLLEGDLIDTQAEDFQFNYSTVVEPESRHPYFIRGYASGIGEYMGNYFMLTLEDSKSTMDTRIQSHVYRQAAEERVTTLPSSTCLEEPKVDYGYGRE